MIFWCPKTYITFNIVLHCKIWNEPTYGTYKYELIFSKSTPCHTYVVSWQWFWIGGVGTRSQSWRGWFVDLLNFDAFILHTICFCDIGDCLNIQDTGNSHKEITGNIVFTKIKLLLIKSLSENNIHEHWCHYCFW